jgi:hypothetical protein
LPFIVYAVWTDSCFPSMLLMKQLNKRGNLVVTKSYVCILTDYNEHLPYCCDILEPSCRPTLLPPPDPGNSTQTRGSRKLEHRHRKYKSELRVYLGLYDFRILRRFLR